MTKRRNKIGAALLVGVLALFIIVAVVRWSSGPAERGPPSRTATDVSAPSVVYLRTIGTEKGERRLKQPVGVAVSPTGELFVADSGHQRIAVFGEEGTFVRAFGMEGEGPGELDRPMHLEFGTDGLLYVAEYINDRISVFRQDGTFVRHVKPKGVDAPAGVAVDDVSAVYVADFYNHRVVVLSPDGSERVWGRPGQGGLGELHYPTDVAIAAEGVVWIADAYNNRVQRFVSGEATGVITGFHVVNGLAVDLSGRVWAADFDSGKIKVFLPDGTPFTVFGEPGSGPAQFQHPTDVAVATNRVYVADFGNDRVQVWRLVEHSGHESGR